jgi:hypothetical protein
MPPPPRCQVVASYRMSALGFPAVLERLQLAPFDMVKMIGAAVKADPSMPKWVPPAPAMLATALRLLPWGCPVYAVGRARACWGGGGLTPPRHPRETYSVDASHALQPASR